MRLLTPDFIEFIECCVRRDVQFLIVGGYAVAAHGHPRATKDLDVWVLIDPTNADHLIQALEDFGMASVGLTAKDFLEPEVVVQLGYPPIRIDLLTSVSGVTFEENRWMPLNDAGFLADRLHADTPVISPRKIENQAHDLADLHKDGCPHVAPLPFNAPGCNRTDVLTLSG